LFVQSTSDVDWYEWGDGGDADTDEEAEALHAHDGSTQNLEVCKYSTSECEDWTVYYRPVKFDYGEANAMASNVSEVKTIAITDKMSKLNIMTVWHLAIGRRKA
jgi:hypothetical protein